MNIFTTKDGRQIRFMDWGKSAPAKLVNGTKLIVHPGASHGPTDTHKDKLNADLLAFIKS